MVRPRETSAPRRESGIIAIAPGRLPPILLKNPGGNLCRAECTAKLEGKTGACDEVAIPKAADFQHSGDPLGLGQFDRRRSIGNV
jgi:hypothetical protein